MLGHKIVMVVLDNRGYGCIHRLQQFCGGPGFNNMLEDCLSVEGGAPKTDFAAHARALGANAEKVGNIQQLEAALVRAKASPISYLITLDTDVVNDSDIGGSWWDVAVPEVSPRDQVVEARRRYESFKARQLQNL
jgi:3D-(3,5/4)-trihydroxycyclohexane-1,2-dione acylhydrolase (decyclizing)